MKAGAIIVSILTALIILPIWFYLWHYTLLRVCAGELQMFLFWVYVPLHFLTALLKVIVDSVEKK